MKLYLLFIIGISLFISRCNTSFEDKKDFNNDDFTENTDNEDFNSDNLNDLEEKMEEIMDENSANNEKLIKEIIEVKANDAKSVKIEIKIAACRLNLSSGAKELFKGGFAYSQKKWKPIIIYNVKNGIGFLSIEQPENNNMNFNDDDQYVWNLKFTNKLPIDFNLEFGAGISEIKLSDLNVRNFNMTMGVGKTELDLIGDWKQNTEIHMDGGIGYTKVYMPDNVGVKINVTKGLGNIDVKNLIKKDDKTYINKLYGKTEKTINIYIKTGIGKIDIE
ncbi:MAG: hypothetical protein JXR51_03355 [Bacteroidales bacterium]|nr:hypothetical protein [Bacteroidales bacterium]MBN2756189.1 hypothetical protein [Bacteroidales bacterium]